MEIEEKITFWTRTKKFLSQCVRVIKVTRKPSMLEFKTIVKVSALGMVIIGVVGFLIHMVKELIV